jgi:hypothetical protein
MDKLIVSMFFVVVLALFLGVVWTMKSAACGWRWSESGMESKWGWFSGCMVQQKSGGWVPEDRVRFMEE